MIKAKISYMKKLKLLKSYQDNDILKFDFKRNEIKLNDMCSMKHYFLKMRASNTGAYITSKEEKRAIRL